MPALVLTPVLRWSPATAPAFAASLAIHVAIGVALVGLASTDRMARGDELAPLAVRLVDSPPPPVPLPMPAPMETIVSPQAEAAALPVSSIEVAPAPLPAAPAPGSTATEAPILAEVRPDSAASVPASGAIAVSEPDSGMAGLSTDIVARAHTSYMIEVEKPVRVVRMPEVVYPPAALDAQREGTVVMWLAIDREGTIEDIVVDSGSPEFIDAVTAALPSAKFLPAEERGEIIPFYIVLQFMFRAAAATASAAGTVESGK